MVEIFGQKGHFPWFCLHFAFSVLRGFCWKITQRGGQVTIRDAFDEELHGYLQY